MSRERLDKFLASEGLGTRSEVRRAITQGLVCVNGVKALRPELKVDAETDEITLAGEAVRSTRQICVMMNKPAGVLSATRDPKAETVVDLIAEPWGKRLFPAGRLDRDTEGFILLTDDGKLAHDILHPRRHIPKTYFVILDGEIGEKEMRAFRAGLDIGDDKPTRPARLVQLSVDGDFITEQMAAGPLCPGVDGDFITEQLRGERSAETENLPLSEDDMRRFCLESIALTDFARCGENECCCAVAITEGRFHQIKRMFAAVGRQVLFLKRIAMGELNLDPSLTPGAYRVLSEDERARLLRGRSAQEAADNVER